MNAYNGMVDAGDKAYLDKHYGQPTCKVGSKPEKTSRRSTEDRPRGQARAYEEESYQTIMGLKGSCSQVPWAVFETFLKKVYKRKK